MYIYIYIYIQYEESNPNRMQDAPEYLQLGAA